MRFQCAVRGILLPVDRARLAVSPFPVLVLSYANHLRTSYLMGRTESGINLLTTLLERKRVSIFSKMAIASPTNYSLKMRLGKQGPDQFHVDKLWEYLVRTLLYSNCHLDYLTWKQKSVESPSVHSQPPWCIIPPIAEIAQSRTRAADWSDISIIHKALQAYQCQAYANVV